MTTVNGTTAYASNVPTAPTAQPETGTEFNTFLELLTAQLRNQDPLAPLDSTWEPFSGNPLPFAVNIPENADKAVLSVKDETGKTVWTKELEAGTESFTWKGENQTTDEVSPAGNYQFGVDIYISDEYAGTVAPRTTAS